MPVGDNDHVPGTSDLPTCSVTSPDVLPPETYHADEIEFNG